MATNRHDREQSRSTVLPLNPPPGDDGRVRAALRPLIVVPLTRGLLLTLFISISSFGLASVAMALGHAVEETSSVTGRVTLTAANGVKSPAAGVQLNLTCEAEPQLRVEISDQQGAFRFERVPAEGCTISTDLQGFRSESAAITPRPAAELRFHLEVEPIFASVTVTGGASVDASIGCRLAGRTTRVRR